MGMGRRTKNIIYSGVIWILALVVLCGGLRLPQHPGFHSPQASESGATGKTIIRDGVAYFPRLDITVVMVLGIDRHGPVTPGDPGEAELILLLIFDETDKTVDALQLDRDTMARMPALGDADGEGSAAFGQLALSHTYGSGMQDSCINVKNTLESLMHGLRIDYFISMHMDAISMLNDAVGGVTVTVTEDFSDVDPTILKGEYTLRGQQAIAYVCTRKDASDQRDGTRMARQQAYMESFLEAFREKNASDDAFFLQTYEQILPYIVTDMSASGIWERYSGYTLGSILTLAGDSVTDGANWVFCPDEDALDALVVELFYAEKQ